MLAGLCVVLYRSAPPDGCAEIVPRTFAQMPRGFSVIFCCASTSSRQQPHEAQTSSFGAVAGAVDFHEFPRCSRWVEPCYGERGQCSEPAHCISSLTHTHAHRSEGFSAHANTFQVVRVLAASGQANVVAFIFSFFFLALWGPAGGGPRGLAGARGGPSLVKKKIGACDGLVIPLAFW